MILFSIRYGYVQLKVNKKRLRKKSRVYDNLNEENREERVLYLLKTGRLLDYTHPSEVDEYMKYIYILYEYSNIMQRLFINDFYNSHILHGKKIKKEDLKELIYVIKLYEGIKRKTIEYMLNGIKIIMGAVVKNRFYGHRRIWWELFNVFTETFLFNITHMRYDVNKTRMSVYFYQSFWLSGLTYLKRREEIIKERERYLHFPEYYNENRGLKILSKLDENIENFDDINDSINNNDIYEENKDNDREIDRYDNVSESDSNDNIIEEGEDYSNITDERISIEEDVQRKVDIEKLRYIISKILIKLKIDINTLYEMDEKKIEQLGKRIKSEIEKGKIKLSEEEFQFIKNYMFNL